MCGGEGGGQNAIRAGGAGMEQAARMAGPKAKAANTAEEGEAAGGAQEARSVAGPKAPVKNDFMALIQRMIEENSGNGIDVKA